MKSDIRTILLGIGQFLFCALLSGLAYGLYVLNLEVRVPVESVIELGQETLLLASGLLMVWTARRERVLAGGLWLIAGFLLTLFIRELDGWMDDIAPHFWVYVAIIWLCAVAWLVKDAGLRTVIRASRTSPGTAPFRSSALAWRSSSSTRASTA